MSFFRHLMGMDGDLLEYGNLAELHPLETFAQLKARRESNFTILKAKLEAGRYTMPSRRLEVSIPTGQTIQSTNIRFYGTDREDSQLIVYPFVPQTGVTAGTLITPRYGDIHTFQNVTIKSPVKNYFHETYSCILKPGGATNQIQILGSVRDDFWAEMVPGKTVFYGWTFSVLGETKIILSANSGTGIITLTTNISAAVSADTQGVNVNFGTSFPEDVSEEDYLEFGRAWVLNNFESNRIIYGVPAATTGTDYTINAENVNFENTAVQVLVSMGNAKMNFTDVSFINGSIPLSFFSRNTAGGQTLTSYGTLLVEEAGDYVAGAIATLEPSGNYGAGGYIHDNVIVKSYGILHLKNNTSASWRQYSSSYSPANPGFNYYANIIEEGSGEYGMLMSNTVPTVIDSITSTGQVLMRHDTTINGGDMEMLSVQGTDFGLGDRTGIFNDVTLRGVINLRFFKYGELNDCVYVLPLFSTLQVMISPSSNLSISGGEVQAVSGVAQWSPVVAGAEGARLLANGDPFFQAYNISIDGLEWSAYWSHYFITTNSAQSPYIERNFLTQINNCDIKALAMAVDGSSIAGSVSKTFSGSNNILRSNYYSTGHQGRGFVQSIQGLQGTVSKTITASKSFGLVGALTNILELDWEHDEYQTTGTILSIIASGGSVVSSNPVYARNIRLHAVGGDIILNTFDAILRPTSNIIGTNGTVITSGNYLDITIDNDYVFQTGTSVVTPTLGTGTGLVSTYKGVLADFILDPTVIMNITAGAINVNADVNGVFTDAAVVGFVDYWTGKYEFRFTSPVPNLTNIILTYNKPNVWKNIGAWII